MGKKNRKDKENLFLGKIRKVRKMKNKNEKE
jgi:hypothetical protein